MPRGIGIPKEPSLSRTRRSNSSSMCLQSLTTPTRFYDSDLPRNPPGFPTFSSENNALTEMRRWGRKSTQTEVRHLREHVLSKSSSFTCGKEGDAIHAHARRWTAIGCSHHNLP